MQCPACRPLKGELYDPDTKILYVFDVDYITRPLNVEDGKVANAL